MKQEIKHLIIALLPALAVGAIMLLRTHEVI